MYQKQGVQVQNKSEICLSKSPYDPYKRGKNDKGSEVFIFCFDIWD